MFLMQDYYLMILYCVIATITYVNCLNISSFTEFFNFQSTSEQILYITNIYE